MHSFNSALDRCLTRVFSRDRTMFLCGGYLLCQLGLFLYAVTIPGMEDRFGAVRGRDVLQFYVTGGIIERGESHRLYDQDYVLQKQYELTPITAANRRKRQPLYSLYPPTVPLAFAPLTR